MSSENLNFEKAIPLNTEIPLKQPDKEITIKNGNKFLYRNEKKFLNCDTFRD